MIWGARPPAGGGGEGEAVIGINKYSSAYCQIL